MLLTLVACVALVLAGPTAALAGPTWHFETLDGVGSVKPGSTSDGVGRDNATIVLNGQLHVFTRDLTLKSLRHDWWDGTAWHFEILDGLGSVLPGHTNDDVGLNTPNTAVTIFDGQIHLFALDGTTHSLRHVWLNGGGWHFETLDGTGSGKPGHSTDSVGDYNAVIVLGTGLHVFTHDLTSDNLRHDWWDGKAWHFETLDGVGSNKPGHTFDGVGQGNFVTLYNGQPHLFTKDETANALRHDWWDGVAWHFETLDGAGSTKPGHTSDSVGSANVAVVYGTHLHAFTWDSSKFSLRHDWWDGAAWHFETLDGAGSVKPGHTTDQVGSSNAAAVFNNQIHLFTWDQSTFTLHHDWWDGTAWHFEILDGPGSTLPGHTSDFAGTDNAVTIYGVKLEVFTDSFNIAAVYSLRHDWLS